ncbi:MAG: GNAT family N-acetyltransferase [Clostridia bacterium]|nr:GNAT family N-acetyltransferase [Clostridia bacterium]
MSDYKQKINIRTLDSRDLEAAKALWLASFPDDDESFVDYYFRARTAPERTLGLFVSEEEGSEAREKLVSMLCFEELFMRVSKGKTARGAFVAGVCTSPEYRRRGFVRRLFEVLEARLAPLGCEAMVLQPFDFGFYEKLGFRAFAVRNICKLKSGEYQLLDPFSAGECCKPKSAGENARIVLLDEDMLYRVYGAYTENLCGALVRTREKCAAVLEEYAVCGGRALAVKTDSGEAYALWYGAEDDGGEERKKPVRLDEFAFTGEAAAEELILRLLDELGAVELPLPTAFSLACGECGVERFNMLKPIGERRFEEFLGESEPFDSKRY